MTGFCAEDEGLIGLSPPVEAAVDPAVSLAEPLARELVEGGLRSPRLAPGASDA